MASLKHHADRVARWAIRCHQQGEAPPPAEIRDVADETTGGDLDTQQMDILCDMIDRRVAKALLGPRRVKQEDK